MSATAYKTAWADAEHVRLASYRSPDDGTKVAIRGAVPPFLDPWLGSSIPADGRSEKDGRTLRPREDEYARHRCGCGHLVYADEAAGGSCRFCPCSDHRPAGAP